MCAPPGCSLAAARILHHNRSRCLIRKLSPSLPMLILPILITPRPFTSPPSPPPPPSARPFTR
eukprot:4200693-Pyramimonas_sp.AAC.1